MSAGRVKTDVFGQESALQYSPAWAGYCIIAMRAGLGWMFFQIGVTRILAPAWTSAQLLQTVPETNPLRESWTVFVASGGWPLDVALSWGIAFVGVGLLFGAFLRFSAVLGSGFTLWTWAMSIPRDGPFVNRHVVYLLVLFSLVTFGAGRIAGLDALFENHPLVERYPLLKWLLG